MLTFYNKALRSIALLTPIASTITTHFLDSSEVDRVFAALVIQSEDSSPVPLRIFRRAFPLLYDLSRRKSLYRVTS